MKKLWITLLSILGLMLVLEAGEIPGVQKFVNDNRNILVSDAINRKAYEIMEKLVAEYGRNKKFEPQDKDLMLQKAKEACVASFDTNAAKETCEASMDLKISNFFYVDSILYKRESYITAYNQGDEFVCTFFTLNGKEVQVVINKMNSKLYKAAKFLKDDILTNIENCEPSNNY